MCTDSALGNLGSRDADTGTIGTKLGDDGSSVGPVVVGVANMDVVHEFHDYEMAYPHKLCALERESEVSLECLLTFADKTGRPTLYDLLSRT